LALALDLLGEEVVEHRRQKQGDDEPADEGAYLPQQKRARPAPPPRSRGLRPPCAPPGRARCAPTQRPRSARRRWVAQEEPSEASFARPAQASLVSPCAGSSLWPLLILQGIHPHGAHRASYLSLRLLTVYARRVLSAVSLDQAILLLRSLREYRCRQSRVMPPHANFPQKGVFHLGEFFAIAWASRVVVFFRERPFHALR
jgi:hypothetical protein